MMCWHFPTCTKEMKWKLDHINSDSGNSDTKDNPITPSIAAKQKQNIGVFLRHCRSSTKVLLCDFGVFSILHLGRCLFWVLDSNMKQTSRFHPSHLTISWWVVTVDENLKFQCAKTWVRTLESEGPILSYRLATRDSFNGQKVVYLSTWNSQPLLVMPFLFWTHDLFISKFLPNILTPCTNQPFSILKHTVDGSVIRRSPPGMYKTR